MPKFTKKEEEEMDLRMALLGLYRLKATINEEISELEAEARRRNASAYDAMVIKAPVLTDEAMDRIAKLMADARTLREKKNAAP